MPSDESPTEASRNTNGAEVSDTSFSTAEITKARSVMLRSREHALSRSKSESGMSMEVRMLLHIIKYAFMQTTASPSLRPLEGFVDLERLGHLHIRLLAAGPGLGFHQFGQGREIPVIAAGELALVAGQHAILDPEVI